MGANLDFIQNNIVNHVWNYDNWSIALAFNGCAEEDCEVRTYGAGATAPTWARFSSPNARGPDGSYWWVFEYVGNDPPEMAPPLEPQGTAPWWGLDGAVVPNYGPKPPTLEATEEPGAQVAEGPGAASADQQSEQQQQAPLSQPRQSER